MHERTRILGASFRHLGSARGRDPRRTGRTLSLHARAPWGRPAEKRGHLAGSCGCSLTAQGHSRAMVVDRMPTTRIGVTWDPLHAPLLRLLPPRSPRDTGSRHGLCGSRPYPRDLSLGPSGPSGRQLEQNFLKTKPADCSLQQNYCLECCLRAWGAHLLGATASIKACMHSVFSPACATSAKLGS